MTDVYISCADADAERVAPVVEALKAEGWSVWYEPDTNSERREYAIDAELGAAGAVIVLWSSHSRDSEAVRTEAATGLYRNKLIQISMGGETPPRPFDQLEVIDLGRWSGEESDPVWQRILGCIRLFAGSPGAHRPQVVRNSAKGFASEAAARPSARPANAPPPVEQVAESEDLNGSSSQEIPAQPETIKVAPKHVFDEPIEDAPPSAERVDRSLGVTDQDQSRATVTPGASASPIDQAVSEMERKISSAAQPTEYAPLPDVESHGEREWESEPETNEPEVYEASSYQSEPYEPEPYEPEPYEPETYQSDPYEPEPQPPKNEPIRFAPVGGFDAPSGKRGDRDWTVSRDDRDWIADEMAASTDNELFVRPRSDAARPKPQMESRSNGIAPVAIVGALAVIGGAVWFVDPMGWRAGGEKAAFAESPGGVEAGPVLPVASGPLREDPVAREAWASVDRTDPEELRSFIFEYSDTYSAETAHALLRALDAQAWADAVTADIEAGYQSYLAEFPAPNGEMAGAASNRLASLGAERKQAITAIQVQLGALNIYRGQTTGEADAASQQAADRFASRNGGAAPALEHAAPRDLRAFGDQILAAVRADAGQSAGSAQVAALAVRPEPAPETGAPTRPAPAAPSAAEREPVASPETAVAEAAIEDGASADSLATEALQRAAWESASRAGTIEAYGAFLRDYPDSQNVIAARAAIEQLSRPAAYGLDWLSDDTRTWVAAAREAQQQARGRAAAARERAGEADQVAASARSGLADARTVVAPDGDIYETQVSNSQPNGLGVRTAGDAQSSGDRYRGELRDGLGQGLGVYEFGDNPNNQAAQAQRYEGEHVNDVARGYGVTQWRNGNRFEGQDNGEAERGVMIFANGQRYEGQMLNGNRHGYGVFWTADGTVMMAGRWENGDLVEPMAPHEGPDFEAIMASAPVLTAASGPADASEAAEADDAADNASE